jgi:vancomycin resistance protein YoaR
MTPLSSKQKTALFIGGIFCLYLIIVGAYHYNYRGQVFPGVRLDGREVGTLSKDELLNVTAEARANLRVPATVTVKNPVTNETAVVSLKNAYTIDGNALWDATYAQGRSLSQGWTYAPFFLRLRGPNLSVAETIHTDSARLAEELAKTVNAAAWNRPSSDARFVFQQSSSSKAFIATIQEGTDGQIVDIDASVERVIDHLHANTSGSVDLAVAPTTNARRTTSDLQPLLAKAQQWVNGPVTLARADGTTITTLAVTTFGDWIEVSPSSTPAALQLSAAKASAFFDNLPSTRLQAPTNGSLEVDAENRITKLTPPTRGQTLNLSETLRHLQAALEGNRQATVAIETSYGVFEGPDAERLGIRSFMGIGHSSFAGSPSNRRKNIALGAKKVDSTLVAPDTEFSLLKVLGEIDGEHGWLPELVIKGNKTLPEFGGGLCQIGTTIFRAALNTGLPITERRNHSYRVSYYEPAGTDATIYDPAPDFKFKNDTKNWILATKETTADEVNFLIWGTPDGRVASSSKPVISNIVAPPPKKIIETTEIPVGTTKCTETAHAGATASFNYEVTYGDGQTKKTTFNSVYKPWQAVCLVGVAKVTAPVDTTTVDETGLNNPG